MHNQTGLGALISLWVLSLSFPMALAAPAAVLKRSEAEVRKKQVENPEYRLAVELPEADQPFKGQVTISFRFHPQKQPLRVDFSRGNVSKLLLNGQAAAFQYDQSAIIIPEESLKAGTENVIEIAYEHAYSKDGFGLYRAVDPVDGKVYTYTKLEPFAANQVFPCFDQPDLKASYQLTVAAPKDWTVVTAVRETSVHDKGAQRVWEFPRTPKFSTYLVSLIAGPYRVWDDRKFRIPLRLLSRQSLAEHVPVDEWFRITRKGLDYYEKFLGVPYAFGKYDQILVPDFVAGAMENVAAVTFNEGFVVRGKRTLIDDQRLATIVLHEMAHMWFGDLVTMSWFGDLWLNESFATYASYLALAQDGRFPDAWFEFLNEKSGGYYADQLVTTHPIVEDIPDTDAASANFDGITYNKGAAFLKLLHSKLGNKAFQKGLVHYFKEHAYGNTRLVDFLSAMEKASGQDLKKFGDEWLMTSGLNTLRPDYRCEKGRVVSFDLVQGAALAAHPTLREHPTRIQLLSFTGERFRVIKDENLAYQGARTPWKGALGQVCPDLVLTNVGDQDYVKTLLDPRSFETVRLHLNRIEDPMQRAMLWNAVAEAATSADIPASDFVGMLSTQLSSERHVGVLQVIDDLVSYSVIHYVRWMDASGVKQKLLQPLAQAYHQTITAAETDSDVRHILWRNYLNLLVLTEDRASVLALWEGRMKSLNELLNQDERWRLLNALSRLGHEKTLAWTQDELRRDTSHNGKLAALGVQAAFPDYAQKLKLLDSALHEPGKSAAERRAVIAHVLPQTQNHLRERYGPIFVKEMDRVVSEADPLVARSYASTLVPMACGPSSRPLMDELITRNYRKDISKALRINQQANERCERMLQAQLGKWSLSSHPQKDR